jgi:hypothetical protein
MELPSGTVDSNQRSILSSELGPKSKSPPLPNMSVISNGRSPIGPDPGCGGGGADVGIGAFAVGGR